MSRLGLAVLFLVVVIAPASAQTFKTEHYDVKLTVVADGLDHPWGMAFLPDLSLIHI